MVNPNIDELSVMTYISYFRDAQPKEGMPIFGPVEVAVAVAVEETELDMTDAPSRELPTFKVFTDEIASVEQAREYAEVTMLNK